MAALDTSDERAVGERDPDGLAELVLPLPGLDHWPQMLHLPVQVSQLSPQELGDELQRWAAHTSWASSRVGALRAQLKIANAEMAFHTHGQKGRSREDRMIAAALEGESAKAKHDKLIDLEARLARAEGYLDAYRTMRDTLSRQVEILRLEVPLR